MVEKKEPKHFRLAPDVIDLLLQAVEAERRTQTDIVEEAIRKYLKERGYKVETDTGSNIMGV
jgi:predicted transcriptional regulator